MLIYIVVYGGCNYYGISKKVELNCLICCNLIMFLQVKVHLRMKPKSVRNLGEELIEVILIRD